MRCCVIILPILVVSPFHPFAKNIVHGQEELNTRIVRSFSSPGPSPQDLAWDGNHTWVADDSTDVLYKLNPSDGSILSSLATPGAKPRGLTWDGFCLWCSDGDSVKIFKLDPSDGSVLHSIPAPTETWIDAVRGLTWDGSYLWSANFAGWSSKVYQVDPTNGRIIRSFYCDAEGLAFDGEYLWSVDSQQGFYLGFIEKRNISNGHWVSYFRTPGYYPTGLTFDGAYLWLADNGTDTIYKIGIKGDINSDGAADILDVVRCVDVILGIGTPPIEYELWAADCNWDGKINVLDVVWIINEILGNTLKTESTPKKENFLKCDLH